MCVAVVVGVIGALVGVAVSGQVRFCNCCKWLVATRRGNLQRTTKHLVTLGGHCALDMANSMAASLKFEPVLVAFAFAHAFLRSVFVASGLFW